ncbi:DsbA family protein [Streptomyces sp. NBC_00820]|uniref:DsbA family protein n=1 Tax=Streptomyces sp. NBC_00820 TaxID=2975842 RepID=UPI002ED4D588|nr:DsbA family protein [Streptomyces sp. NBC_00820]
MRSKGFAAAVAVAVLGLSAVGCGTRYHPTGHGSGEAELTPAYAGLGDVPERLSADGTTITVGDPDAAITVHLYEDPRCPVCEEFETEGGAPVLRDTALHRITKTEYTLASFLDGRLGGKGSEKAVNALRAALEAGRFAEYHDVLFAHQPPESTDGFTDARLLELAGKVEGLRGPAFDSAVRSMKYRSFVTASQKVYERAGGAGSPQGPGTPTAEIDGKRIPARNNAVLFSGERFAGLLALIGEHPDEWRDVTL